MRFSKSALASSRTWKNRLIVWLMLWSLRPNILEDRKLKDYKIENWTEEENIIVNSVADRSWKMSKETGKLPNNPSVECFPVEGYRKCKKSKMLEKSTKDLNREARSRNGNGTTRSNITIMHWNLGSKRWIRKMDELEAVTIQYRPDIFAVSEANLLEATTQRDIPGYRILLPKTSETQSISRIIVLIREGIEVEVLD